MGAYIVKVPQNECTNLIFTELNISPLDGAKEKKDERMSLTCLKRITSRGKEFLSEILT